MIKVDDYNLSSNLYDFRELCLSISENNISKALNIYKAQVRVIDMFNNLMYYRIFLNALGLSLYNYILFTYGVSVHNIAYKHGRELHTINTKEQTFKQGEIIIREYYNFIQSLRNDNKKEIILNVIKYINNNYTGECSLEECANAANTSISYLSTTFKKHMGVSFIEFVNEKKIRYAKQLLLTTDMNVNEISTACGFSSSSYFCRVFHKTTNLSTSEYKKIG